MVKITKPTDVNEERQPIHVVLVGQPGAGKSTLACSAPNPIWLDLEHGRDRVDSRHYVDCITLEDLNNKYQELYDFLHSTEIDAYDTIIFDTGKGLQKLLTPYLGQVNPSYVQGDGTLTLKGYTPLLKNYENLLDYLLIERKKHVVTVLHVNEKDKGDLTVYKPDLDGQMKNAIWRSATLACMLETRKDKRVLSFKNCDVFTGKRNHGIEEEYLLPDVSDDKPNNFLTLLFEQYQKNVASDKEATLAIRREFDGLMASMLPSIEAMTADNVNEVYKAFTEAKHVAGSYTLLKNAFVKRTKEIGVKWNAKANLWE